MTANEGGGVAFRMSTIRVQTYMINDEWCKAIKGCRTSRLGGKKRKSEEKSQTPPGDDKAYIVKI